MGLLSNLTEEIKNAMRAKDTLKLESLRAIKSAVLLAQTASGGTGTLTEEETIKLLQRLVKQRKESATIFNEQGRADLAAPEEAQAAVIAYFLPEQLSKEEVAQIIIEIIDETGAEGMKDMGKVMGALKKDYADEIDFAKAGPLIKELLGS